MIDAQEDPEGRAAMRKIDFSAHSMNCGRKEFVSKREALRALEKSKSKVTEMIQ